MNGNGYRSVINSMTGRYDLNFLPESLSTIKEHYQPKTFIAYQSQSQLNYFLSHGGLKFPTIYLPAHPDGAYLKRVGIIVTENPLYYSNYFQGHVDLSSSDFVTVSVHEFNYIELKLMSSDPGSVRVGFSGEEIQILEPISLVLEKGLNWYRLEIPDKVEKLTLELESGTLEIWGVRPEGIQTNWPWETEMDLMVDTRDNSYFIEFDDLIDYYEDLVNKHCYVIEDKSTLVLLKCVN